MNRDSGKFLPPLQKQKVARSIEDIDSENVT